MRAEAGEKAAELKIALDRRLKALAEEFSQAKRTLEHNVDRHEETLDTVTATHAESNGQEPKDAFLTIEQASVVREQLRRAGLHRKSNDEIRLAGERLERIPREWDSARSEYFHQLEILQARAQGRVSAYDRGVMETFPRKEELVAAWKKQIRVLDVTGDGNGVLPPAREVFKTEIESVRNTVELWRRQRGQLGSGSRPGRPRDPEDDTTEGEAS
ncbi:hypothetical protein [Streptosporangium sp. V21-05]|uniref:hypothetical protein n=1 Tax=Streptosporangium sp. V21-05 TaxID=3446115 RepID=UPI003F53DBC7